MRAVGSTSDGARSQERALGALRFSLTKDLHGCRQAEIPAVYRFLMPGCDTIVRSFAGLFDSLIPRSDGRLTTTHSRIGQFLGVPGLAECQMWAKTARS